MKKIVSLLVALVIVLSLSVSAFAVKSPVAPTEIVITSRQIITKIGEKVQAGKITVEKGSQIVFKYDPSKGKFDRIAYYVVDEDGKAITKNGEFVEAVEGVDYEVVSENDKEFTVKVNTDLIVCGDYNGKKTNPNTGEPIDDESPETGVNDVTAEVVIAAILLAGAAFVFAAKKREA